jgi:3-deoxy-D-manno-octulosonic acid kinase
VKRYTPNRKADALKLLARQQRGPKAFGLSLRLFTAGLPVPEPYGWLVERRRTGRRRSYYLCQALADCEDLRNLALACRGQSFPGAMDLVRESAAILARLHARGYRHGDYKWANLMLEGSSGKLWLIDLDSLRPMSTARSRAGRGRDLARFVLDGEELGQGQDVLGAFTESYAQACELTPEQVMAMAEGPLRMFRERHLKRYGEAGPYGPTAPVPANG